jgi:hypothetical protein
MKVELKDMGDGRNVQILEGASMAEAERLASSINMVRALGVEIASDYSAVVVDGRAGLEFTMPPGRSFMEWLGSSMFHWDRMVSLLAHEAHEMHLHTAPELDGVKDRIGSRLDRSDLPVELVAKVRAVMKKLPDGDFVCNWNCVPESIIVGLDGPRLVRWDGLLRGPYLADVARTVVLLKAAGENVLADTFGKEYMKICGKPDDEMDSWMLIVAADRLVDGIESERETLGRIVRKFA